MCCALSVQGGQSGSGWSSGGSFSLLPGFAVVLALTQGPSAQQPQGVQCHGAGPEAGSGPGGLRVRAWAMGVSGGEQLGCEHFLPLPTPPDSQRGRPQKACPGLGVA